MNLTLCDDDGALALGINLLADSARAPPIAA